MESESIWRSYERERPKIYILQSQVLRAWEEKKQ